MDEAKQVEVCVKRLKKELGWKAWQLLGWELQQKLVRAEVLAVIAGLASFEDSYAGRLAAKAIQWDSEA